MTKTKNAICSKCKHFKYCDFIIDSNRKNNIKINYDKKHSCTAFVGKKPKFSDVFF